MNFFLHFTINDEMAHRFWDSEIAGDLAHVDEWAADHRPCVENIKDFTSCFLFSIETQHTIG
jgi:Inward rectifier potassium channel transmembrane domain